MNNPLDALLEAFATLQRQGTPAPLTGLSAFNALPFPGRPQDKVAIDQEGAPVILIHTDDEGLGSPPTELTYLSVRHRVQCDIIDPQGHRERHAFSTIRFRGDDPGLLTYFLRVVGSSVLALPDGPAEREISRMMARLAELFNALSQQPKQSAQGLWGEVFMISQARDPASVVRAWRLTPEDTFDFTEGDNHVEVKSVVGTVRHHHFSLGQLRPADGSDVIICSLLLRTSENATSLGDLITLVRDRLGTDQEARLIFDRNVALTLGNSIAAALRVRFDAAFAITHCRFLRASTIPSVPPQLPSEITDVRFTVDITTLPHLPPNEEGSPLFEAARPR